MKSSRDVRHLATPKSLVGRLFVGACVLVGMSNDSFASDWQFVLPPAGAEHEHPPLRAIPLSTEKPDDLKEKAEYRGASRRYAQLRYGSPGAARVAVVLDEISASEADLYVDRNRNRTIEAGERCSGEARLWRVPLDVEYVEGEVTKRYPRELLFRRGATGRTLSFAAAGYLQGKTSLGDGGLREVRRLDGDGNGFFTDPQDRLWIDLDGDGAWDPVKEQFLFATILTLDGVRYALRSDERGTQLSLGKLEGTGVLRLVLPERDRTAAKEAAGAGWIVEAAVTLVGRDGSAIGLRGVGAKATAPIGEYRISALTVALEDPHGGQRWTFVFSDNQGQDVKRWYKLERDDELDIAPLEKFDFRTGCQAKTACRPGEQISVQPQLYTADGLLINTCYRGQHDTGRDGGGANISLENSEGIKISSALSGFA
jgi:hypothetical protein